MRFRYLALLAASLFIGSGPAASAAYTLLQGWDPNTGAVVPSYTNSNSAYTFFVAGINSFGTYGTENFESYTTTAGIQFGIPNTNPYNGTATFTGSSITATTPMVGSFPVAPFGQGYANQGFQNLLGNFGTPDTFTFNQPVRAFGLYLNNIGDSSQTNITNISIQFGLNGNNVTIPASAFPTYTGGGDMSTAFIGVLSDSPFNTFTIIKSTNVPNNDPMDADIDGILYDVMTVSAVPEPGTWALLGSAIGMAGLVGLRRRRQAAA